MVAPIRTPPGKITMTDDVTPTGKRFSHVYLQRGSPASDSERMRRRVAMLFSEFNLHSRMPHDRLGHLLESELGVTLPRSMGAYSLEDFCAKCELRDLLDSITIVWRGLSSYDTGLGLKLVAGVRRILEEENVGYRVDDKAGVHFAVDQEFEHNRSSTISGLAGSRYKAVLDAFQTALGALDKVPPDGKIAMRSVFEAIEILFKLLCPNAPRLGRGEIDQHLKPVIDRVFASDPIACRSVHKMVASLGDWVDGVHFYRHGHGVEERSAPPLGLAVMTVSTAASYLRWLAEIDEKQQSNSLETDSLKKSSD
jgi:hypothetical protein